jgi:WD40 repeat protein
LAFSPDGRYVVGTVDATRASVWDSETGEQVRITPPDESQSSTITRVAMAPSNALLAIGRQGGLVEMWVDDGGAWARLDLLERHGDRVSWLDFDQDSRMMVSTSDDGSARLWDVTTGEVIGKPLEFRGAPGAITFFVPGSETRLVTIDSHNATWEWDLERSGRLRGTIRGVNLGASISESPAVSVLVARGSKLALHDLEAGEATDVALHTAQPAVLGVAASADGTRAAVVRDDGSVELIDAVTADVVEAFDIPAAVDVDDVMIAVDDDGSRVAYLTEDRQIAIVGGGATIDVIALAPWRETPQALDLNRDGTELVLSTRDGEAIWYDLEGVSTDRVARRGEGFDAQFLTDGRVVVVGDNGIQIVDPRSSDTPPPVAVGTGARRVAVDPTGRLLATRGDTGDVRLWNSDSQFPIGEPIRVVEGTGPIAFSSDGRFLVVAGRDEVAWFDVRTSEWPRFACSLVGDAALSRDEVSRLLASDDVPEACA